MLTKIHIAPTSAKPVQTLSRIDDTIKIAIEGPYPFSLAMNATLIGYARCSTDAQDPTAQKIARKISASHQIASTPTTD